MPALASALDSHTDAITGRSATRTAPQPPCRRPRPPPMGSLAAASQARHSGQRPASVATRQIQRQPAGTNESDKAAVSESTDAFRPPSRPTGPIGRTARGRTLLESPRLGSAASSGTQKTERPSGAQSVFFFLPRRRSRQIIPSAKNLSNPAARDATRRSVGI